jgi:hypothetical protein
MASQKQDEVVHGMRGGIPSSRMEQIHSELHNSVSLREILPQLADPLTRCVSGIDW